jgi:hypothetical protein
LPWEKTTCGWLCQCSILQEQAIWD